MRGLQKEQSSPILCLREFRLPCVGTVITSAHFRFMAIPNDAGRRKIV
jgi:hypothetical protein